VLAASMLLRRADGVVVICAALLAKAAGAGHRTVAAWPGRPVGTVRGWYAALTALPRSGTSIGTSQGSTYATRGLRLRTRPPELP
jgi:hypothetical protein